jgi:hypothetical protein
VDDRDTLLAVAPDGLTCQTRHEEKWAGVRANVGVVGGGKYYFESVMRDEGLCRVGWSTLRASLDLGTDPFVRASRCRHRLRCTLLPMWGVAVADLRCSETPFVAWRCSRSWCR